MAGGPWREINLSILVFSCNNIKCYLSSPIIIDTGEDCLCNVFIVIVFHGTLFLKEDCQTIVSCLSLDLNILCFSVPYEYKCLIHTYKLLPSA